MIKTKILMVAIALAVCCGMAKAADAATSMTYTEDYGVIESGDLLFVVSAEENGITSVTQGIGNLAIDHVAIAFRDSLNDNQLKVVEAISRGVCVTPIDTFMRRATPVGGNRPLVVVGRLACRDNVAVWISNALKYVGRPYDHLFMHDDQEIYCSELVMLSYVNKNGKPIFAPIRMSFHDKSGQVTTFWRDYYARRGLRVPEGAQGSNPGQLSRDGNVRIIYRFF